MRRINSRTTRIRMGVISIQLNRKLQTQVCTPLCPHLFSNVYTTNKNYDNTDRFPVPLRTAVKSNITSWCIQNLSRHALNALTRVSIHNRIWQTVPYINNTCCKNVSINRREKYDLDVYNCCL